MTAMLVFTFLLSAFVTTPGAMTSLQAVVAWADLVTDPLQATAGR